jgi:hypothetical protein
MADAAGMCCDFLPALQNFGDRKRARRRPEHDHAGEHRKPAGHRDQKALLRRTPRLPVLRRIADEQERGDAGHFPEHHHQHQIVGEHGAEHRRHEQRQHGVEPAKARRAAQIGGGVEKDRCTDAGDQQSESQRQPVRPERRIDAEAGYPGRAFDQEATGGNLRQQRREPDEERERQQRHERRRAAACPADDRRGQKGKGGKCKQEHCRRLSLLKPPMKIPCQFDGISSRN